LHSENSKARRARMLVLARKQGQRIMIGNDVILTICEIRGDRVRIGINAPRGVSVHREEITRRIQEEIQEEIQNEKE